MGSRTIWIVLLVTALAVEDVRGINKQDVSGFLNNRAFMSNVFSCLMNREPCNFITQEIKDKTHDALHGRCGGCSRGDRHLMTWTIRQARRRYPNEFRQVWRRYY